MQDEKRREVALHFRVLCKWLDVTQNQESLLEEWSRVFCEIKSEYQRMDYLLSTLTLELSPMRILKEDDMAFFVRYHMITILKNRYSDRKKKFERVPILESTYLLSLQPLLGQERKEFSFHNDDYGKHFPETFVDRANYKLTFTLKDFVLSLKNVSGGNFIWKWTREEEECWFYLTNATLYIDDCNKFQSLTIYQEGLTAVELDVRNFITEGKLELDGLLERGKSILVRAKCDIRVIFPSGKERNSLMIKTSSSCKFDLDPCLLEYSSREWFPFPYRFHIPDVDHLLNMERMVSGRPMKPMSPNSAEKYSRGGGIHNDMERLKTLRRMKVYQSLQQFVPYFYVGGESLCVIKENDHLVLYEKNFSLAKCFIKPEKSLILFDLIEFSSSTLIDTERVFRYPPLIY